MTGAAHVGLAGASFCPSLCGSAFSTVDSAIYAAQGDYTSSGISLGAAALGTISDAGAAKAGGLAIKAGIGALKGTRELGSAGEAAADIIKNTERIPSLTGTAAYRVPDELDRASKIIGEVKNVASQSFTSQLRDYAAFAGQTGYQFQLRLVRPTTTLSGPLQTAIKNGQIVLKILP